MAIFFAIALTLATTTFIVRSEEARHQQQLRSHTLHQLSSIRAKAEGIINSTLFLARGVIAYVAGHPEINQEEFHQLAKELLLEDTHIRNMGLARDNVITHMYPIKGNEAAIGLRYMDHPKQRGAVLRAIETKKTVVAGPVNLVQGGKGFISRTPVFLTPSGKKPGTGDYWGIASMVINMATLFKGAGISCVTCSTVEGLRIAIRGKDGLGEEGALFFGDEIVFKSDPVILDVTLPEGSWQIAAIPEKGWNIVSDQAALFKFYGLLISIMLGLSIWLFGRLSEEREQRKLNEAAAEADRLVTELADSLSEIVYRADAITFETLYINNAVENMFGYTAKEWLESPELWEAAIHPEDKERVFNIIEGAKENGKDFSYEYRINKRDRTVRWVEDRITWQRDDEGNISTITGLVYDITERKKAEEELQANNELLDKIFSTTYGLIAYMDKDFNFIRVNQAYADADGRLPDFFIGKNHFDLYPDEENEATFCHVVETGEPYSVYAKPFEYAEHPERSVTYWDWALIPAMDVHGKVDGLLMTLMNVTEHIKQENVLRASEDKYRNLFEHATDSIFILSPDTGRFIDCNEIAAKRLGYKKDELLNLKVFDINPADSSNDIKERFKMQRAGESITFETSHQRKDGTLMPVEISSRLIEHGGQNALQAIVRDISKRKKREEKLQLLEKALETTNIGITIANIEKTIIYTNPFEAKMHGYSVGELIGKKIGSLAPAELRQPLNIKKMKAAKTKKRESVNIRKDGSSFPVYLTSDIVTNPSNDPIGLVTICEDITDRKKAENEIETSRKQLRNLTNSLQSAREEERKKIAREIHDELGQSLTAIKIDLSLMKRKLPKDATSLHNRADKMTDIVNLTLQSVKRIAKELRPEILDELGLEAATKRYIKEFISRTLIKCDLKIVGPCDRLSNEVSLVIFRIIQEATTNIVRHSEAKRARIYLECKEKSLLLKISDNGKGINETDIANLMSIGLTGMNERVLSVGGHFAIRGIRGVGTTVKVYISGEKIEK